MKKYLFFICILIYSICIASNDTNNFWNNIISSKAPKELKEIKVIETKDITDEDNIKAFNLYNPSIIIKDDINNNGKLDVIVPCISKVKKDRWYILIFEQDNDSTKFIKSFEFNMSSIYVFLVKGKNKKSIRVGQSFASDASTYIFWKGKEYIRD